MVEVKWSQASASFSDGSTRGIVINFMKDVPSQPRTTLKTRTITGKTSGLTGGQYSASGTIVLYGFSFNFDKMDFGAGGLAHGMWGMTGVGACMRACVRADVPASLCLTHPMPTIALRSPPVATALAFSSPPPSVPSRPPATPPRHTLAECSRRPSLVPSSLHPWRTKQTMGIKIS